MVKYREEKWLQQFEKLKAYKEEHGHANVPKNDTENRLLGYWVKNQRRNYKKKIQEGEAYGGL